MSRDSLVLAGVLGAAIAAGTMGLAGCASHAHTNAGALHNLRECPLVASENTNAWQRTDVGSGFFVRLPADCAVDRAPQAGGARRWRCGAMTVEIVRGQWSEKAFREGGAACRATLDLVPVALFASGEGVEQRRVAWYLDGHGSGPHPVVIASGAKGADPARLEAVVRSGTFATSGHQGARR
jgi:hypothetical protein